MYILFFANREPRQRPRCGSGQVCFEEGQVLRVNLAPSARRCGCRHTTSYSRCESEGS